jgi:hypothetical protein
VIKYLYLIYRDLKKLSWIYLPIFASWKFHLQTNGKTGSVIALATLVLAAYLVFSLVCNMGVTKKDLMALGVVEIAVSTFACRCLAVTAF